MTVLFVGCSLQTTVPPVAKYLLNVKVDTKPSKVSCYRDKVVRVAQIDSPMILAGRTIIYSTDKGQSYSYTKSRWMESVTNQLSVLIMQTITHKAIFKDVIPFRSLADNDLILETGLYDFSQVIHDDGSSSVHLLLKVRLVEQYSRKIVTNKLFELKKDGLTGDVDGAIEGYNILVRELLKGIDQWLEESCSQANDAS